MKRKYLTNGCLLLGLIGLIVYSGVCSAAAANALRVCALSVIPSLFPFFVLSKLLLSSGFSVPFPERFAQSCFGVSGACMSAFSVSILGGYPAGAAAVADLYKNGAVTKRDAEKALCFCNNSGPAFFLSFIGGTILKSAERGLILYLIHILSALLCGRLFAGGRPPAFQMRQIGLERKPADKQLPKAISESCASLLQISGLIVFFSVMAAIVEEVGLFRLLSRIPCLPVVEIKALLCGVIELTGGILRSADSAHAFVLCAFLMGWGGFCVHTQARAIWQAAGLHPKYYYSAKLLQGLLSAIFALAFTAPSALSVSVGVIVFLLCAVFPAISKNRCSNFAKNTL